MERVGEGWVSAVAVAGASGGGTISHNVLGLTVPGVPPSPAAHPLCTHHRQVDSLAWVSDSALLVSSRLLVGGGDGGGIEDTIAPLCMLTWEWQGIQPAQGTLKLSGSILLCGCTCFLENTKYKLPQSCLMPDSPVCRLPSAEFFALSAIAADATELQPGPWLRTVTLAQVRCLLPSMPPAAVLRALTVPLTPPACLLPVCGCLCVCAVGRDRAEPPQVVGRPHQARSPPAAQRDPRGCGVPR